MTRVTDGKNNEIVAFHDWRDINMELARLNYILACCDNNHEAIKTLIEEGVSRDLIEINGEEWDSIPSIVEFFRIESFGRNNELSYVYIKDCKVTAFDIKPIDYEEYTLFEKIHEMPSKEYYSTEVIRIISKFI